VVTLAERLGYRPDDRLLIVNCDDLGSTYAANIGVYESLREGLATSSSLMVPCPWARDAAARYRGEDVGVHLTLNAEWDQYRWGPITHAPSLLDGDGGFPRTVEDVWDHADLDEVRKELRAQVERAILWGFDVSHLDSHMGTVQLRPEFFDVYLELAIEFQLPIRLSGASTERLIGFPFRQLAAEEGVVFPDHLLLVAGGGSTRRTIERAVMDLRPGVTEVLVHPAIDTPELRASTPDWPNRVDDHDLVTRDHSLRAMLDRAGVTLVSYRQLRDAQRSAA
jgi:chitin disaccharide deacetylase